MQWLRASSAIVPTAVEPKQISFIVVLGGGNSVPPTQGTSGLARLELYSYLYDYGGMLVELLQFRVQYGKYFWPDSNCQPMWPLGCCGLSYGFNINCVMKR